MILIVLATGKLIRVTGMWIRLEGGRIVEGRQWGWDALGFLQQVGAASRLA